MDGLGINESAVCVGVLIALVVGVIESESRSRLMVPIRGTSATH